MHLLTHISLHCRGARLRTLIQRKNTRAKIRSKHSPRDTPVEDFCGIILQLPKALTVNVSRRASATSLAASNKLPSKAKPAVTELV